MKRLAIRIASSGMSPLHWACTRGHVAVLTYLVRDCAVDADARDIKGTTAFTIAAQHGHVEALRCLAALGCKTDSVDECGDDAKTKIQLKFVECQPHLDS